MGLLSLSLFESFALRGRNTLTSFAQVRLGPLEVSFVVTGVVCPPGLSLLASPRVVLVQVWLFCVFSRILVCGFTHVFSLASHCDAAVGSFFPLTLALGWLFFAVNDDEGQLFS